MTNQKNPLILVDFDGTITQNDVGALFFDTFAKEESPEIVSLWVKGQISSKECLERLCQVTEAGRWELKNFALSQKIDGKFPDFVDYCKCKKLKLVILSDGLDFYIKLILKKFGLEELPFFSNVLRFENNRLKPEFPYFDQGCGNCGNCKKHHLQNLKKANQQVIYIGDGLSDKCAAQQADLVLAKNDLRRFCVEEGIKHNSFNDFGDVIRIFQDVIFDQSKDA
jgi:2-hydroxy-3-keto-5-methylthiopentenyl-1-phosphate phosphatase